MPVVGFEPTPLQILNLPTLPIGLHGQIKRDTFLTNALPSELFFHAEKVGIEPTTYRVIEFAVSIPKLVPPRGIEPRSSVLQTGAMTTSAKAAKLG